LAGIFFKVRKQGLLHGLTLLDLALMVVIACEAA